MLCLVLLGQVEAGIDEVAVAAQAVIRAGVEEPHFARVRPALTTFLPFANFVEVVALEWSLRRQTSSLADPSQVPRVVPA